MNSFFGRARNESQDSSANGWPKVRQWASQAGHRFAVGKGGEGFVVETGGAGIVCRIEWGPTQRSYIYGQELRVRTDVGSPVNLQMLAASRQLLERLEHEAFEQITEGTETRMDDQTPEEMRWVVMYPGVPASVLGALHDKFGVLGNRPREPLSWLENGLAGALATCHKSIDPRAQVMIAVQRGRLVVRMALPEPQVSTIEGALALARSATGAARRVLAETSRGAGSTAMSSTWAVSGIDAAAAPTGERL